MQCRCSCFIAIGLGRNVPRCPNKGRWAMRHSKGSFPLDFTKHFLSSAGLLLRTVRFQTWQVKVNIPREHSACQNVVIVGDAIDVSRGNPNFGRRHAVELSFNFEQNSREQLKRRQTKVPKITLTTWCGRRRMRPQDAVATVMLPWLCLSHKVSDSIRRVAECLLCVYTFLHFSLFAFSALSSPETTVLKSTCWKWNKQKIKGQMSQMTSATRCSKFFTASRTAGSGFRDWPLGRGRRRGGHREWFSRRQIRRTM